MRDLTSRFARNISYVLEGTTGSRRAKSRTRTLTQKPGKLFIFQGQPTKFERQDAIVAEDVCLNALEVGHPELLRAGKSSGARAQLLNSQARTRETWFSLPQAQT